MAVLAEEIETPGEGQIRALITSAGNPVLSTPERPAARARARGARLHGVDRSVPQRDHAARARDPAAELAARALALRRRASRCSRCATSRSTRRRCSPPPPDERHDWEICSSLALAHAAARRRAGPGARGARRSGPSASSASGGCSDLLLRCGPHRLSLRKLRAARTASTSGRSSPRLPARLATSRSRLQLAPADLPRATSRGSRRASRARRTGSC